MIFKEKVITKLAKKTSKAIANKETLEMMIKKEFSKEFIEEIYNKYNLTKKDFQEECMEFANYWKGKMQKGKSK